MYTWSCKLQWKEHEKNSSSSDGNAHAHISMVLLRMLTLSPCAPRGGERLLVAEGSQCGERIHKLDLEEEKNIS